jgi:hypothetical protein
MQIDPDTQETTMSPETNLDHEVRELSIAELQAIAGGRVKAIIVLGDCTTDPRSTQGWGVPVIVYNPWIRPGSPERAGTGTSF